MCRYMGGKGRIGRFISEKIKEIEEKNEIKTESYFEPFVGMCGVMRHIPNDKPKVACDYNEDIVNLWRECQNGWEPPTYLSKEDREFIKTQKSSALRCFASHGTSFGGVCWGSYIGNYNKGLEHIKTSSESIVRVTKMIKDVQFLDSRSYLDFSPKNSTIYCDPPYVTARKSTLSVENFKGFNHEEFWDVMRKWVYDGNIVIVSEYTAPSDFVCVWEKKLSLAIIRNRYNGHDRIEKLFVHHSHLGRDESQNPKFCQDNES